MGYPGRRLPSESPGSGLWRDKDGGAPLGRSVGVVGVLVATKAVYNGPTSIRKRKQLSLKVKIHDNSSISTLPEEKEQRLVRVAREKPFNEPQHQRLVRLLHLDEWSCLHN